jgi:hypothetical protein
MLLAVNNQFCDNRDNLVTSVFFEVVTLLDPYIPAFTSFVTTVTTSTRDMRAGAGTHARTHMDVDVTTSHKVIYNHKTETYHRDNLYFVGCHRLSRLSHDFFFQFGGLFMADEVDRANDVVQRHLDAVLNAHKVPHAMADECVECDAPISSERQKATGGTDLCVDCAAADERKRRLYRS